MLDVARPVKHGAPVRFHQGTSELLGRLALSGDSGHARIRFETPAVLTRGDRFVLRSYSPPVTIAGGTVLDPAPPRGPIRTPTGRARFERLASVASAEDVVMALVTERGIGGLSKRALVSRAGLAPSRAAAVTAALAGRKQIVEIGEVLVAA